MQLKKAVNDVKSQSKREGNNMNEKTIELLPCPFCGEAMELRGDYTHETAWNYFEHANAIDSKCILKDHTINAPDFRTPDPAEAAEWNKRAQSLVGIEQAAPPPLREREEIARDEAHERLRTAYQDMEARCAAYQAAAKVDLARLDKDRRELALWAACEAGRWLDQRAGDGPNSEFGLKLEKIAGILSRTTGQEWRDISSAPKDEIFVDLWHIKMNRRVTDCRWRNDEKPDHRGWYAQSGGLAFNMGLDSNFSHYRPLPAPPVAAPIVTEKQKGAE